MTQCTMAAMLLAVLVGWVLAADPGGPAPSTGPYGGAGPVLWYRQPAAKWEQALPIGNGRMGAMVFGGMADERIQFNEDTLWTGRPHEYQHEGAVKFLPRIRQLLQEMRQFEAEGKPKEAGAKQREAEDLAGKEFMSVPLHQKAYQPFGDLRIKFPGHEAAADYRRDLDLDTAVASVCYKVGDVTYLRQAFASHPDQALVLQVSADKPGKVSFTAKVDSPHKSAVARAAGGQLVLAGQVEEGGLKFEARVRILVQGGREEVPGVPRRRRHGLEQGLEDQFLGATPGRRPCPQDGHRSARGEHRAEHVRHAPAVPD